MSGGEKPKGKARGGVWRGIPDFLSGVITKAAALATAIGVLVGVYVTLFGGGSSSRDVRIVEAGVDPNVPIEQYEYASGAGPSADSQASPRAFAYRLASDARSLPPGGARADPALVAVVSTTSSISSATPPASVGSGEVSSAGAEQEEAQKLQSEASSTQAQAQETHTEEADRAVGQTAAQLREEAKAKAEEAQVKATEAAQLKSEEGHSTTPVVQKASVLQREGEAKVAVGTSVPTGEVDAVLRKAGVRLASACGSTCPLRTTVAKAIADYSNDLSAAARQVAAAFYGSRKGLVGTKHEPLGVTVEYSIDFTGYEHKLLVLEWTLYSKRTGLALPREWWRNVIVKQIEPTSEKATVLGNFWAPIPPKYGDYYFRLRVFDGATEVARQKTDGFH